MAEIFLARGASVAGVERYVVLKRVLRERANDAHFLRMFLDEARLAAQLQHPNIAQVYDIGKLGDSYFFTMEYVHGETVRALLQRAHGLKRPLPVAAVLSIASGVAAGLHHAHERNGVDGRPLGIVHRDVSPSNLIVSYEGNVKIVDFGVAKAEAREQQTQVGTVKGKIAYLSPEQCRGDAIDRRSDLFSLGIVMWEMATTERLFRRSSDFETMVAIVNERVPPPSAYRPDVPREVDELILRLLAKAPDDRFPTADALLEAIEATAVRLGTALSTAAVGRFVRELFGHRPEPWIEMASQETHAPAVTITSEPLPAEIVVPPVGPVDQRLTAVLDLSGASDASSGNHPMPDARLDEGASGQRPGPAQMTPSVGSPFVAPAIPPSGRSHPLADPAWTAAFAGKNDEPAPPPPRARRMLIIGGAVVVSAIIGIAVLECGGARKHAGTAPQPASEPGDRHVLAPSAPPPMLAPPSVDAALAPPVAAATIDAASVVTATVDATPVTTATVDAAVVSTAARAPADAAVTTTLATTAPHVRTPAPTPAEELAKQFAADRYAEVVATCTAIPQLVLLNNNACVLSACHVHDASRARRWLKNAGSKRASLTQSCAQLGTKLEAAKPDAAKPETTKPEADKPDCASDPLSCQH